MRLSEVFFSIEGEALFTGFPTLFIRFFGCNFTCSGFSDDTGDPYPDDTFSSGCDSAYSWHPHYKHSAIDLTVDELVQKAKDILGNRKPYIVSFTGGEPTLHQDSMISIMEHPFFKELNPKYLIETNCSVPLKSNFFEYVKDKDVVFSNSPKLSNSGEFREKAIRPDVLVQQKDCGAGQYLKFVSDGTITSFDEICEVLDIYNHFYIDCGYPIISSRSVYVMPEGANTDQLSRLDERVATLCLTYGFIFCPRVHVYVYNNRMGT